MCVEKILLHIIYRNTSKMHINEITWELGVNKLYNLIKSEQDFFMYKAEKGNLVEEIICNQGLCRASKSNLFKKGNNAGLESRNLDESQVMNALLYQITELGLYSPVGAEGNGTNETGETDLMHSMLYLRKQRILVDGLKQGESEDKETI